MNKNTTDQLGDLFAKTPDGMKGTVAYVMATTAIGTLMRMLDSLLSHTRQGTAEERLASAAVHDLKVDLLAALGKFEEACKDAEGSRQERMKEEFAEKLSDIFMCRSETRPFKNQQQFYVGEWVEIEGIKGHHQILKVERDLRKDYLQVSINGVLTWVETKQARSVDNPS